jgi:hypothetical protein
MVPQIETRIDFQEPEIALRIALEVELRDAGQLYPFHDVAAEAPHVGGIGDFQRGGVAVVQWIGADFAAGELAGNAAVRIDVAMIVLDSGLRARDEFLRQERKSCRAQLRPQRAQRLDVLSAQRLAQSERIVPAIEPGQRLDDEREGKADLGRLNGRGVEAARRRHLQAVTVRQILEARLVQIFDQRRIGDDEAERLRQALTMPR